MFDIQAFIVYYYLKGVIRMKHKTQNIEFYFICDDTKNTELIEKKHQKNTTKWYINAYLAYKAWQDDFKSIEGEMNKMFLTLAATKYIMYRFETYDYHTPEELEQLRNELEQINKELANIIKSNELLEL